MAGHGRSDAEASWSAPRRPHQRGARSRSRDAGAAAAAARGVAHRPQLPPPNIPWPRQCAVTAPLPAVAGVARWCAFCGRRRGLVPRGVLAVLETDTLLHGFYQDVEGGAAVRPGDPGQGPPETQLCQACHRLVQLRALIGRDDLRYRDWLQVYAILNLAVAYAAAAVGSGPPNGERARSLVSELVLAAAGLEEFAHPAERPPSPEGGDRADRRFTGPGHPTVVDPLTPGQARSLAAGAWPTAAVRPPGDLRTVWLQGRRP